ncbi:MAG: metallophosphoesterase [Pseudomonadales bacterium]|nr:metallophosphoesterase [Pseudomonadales bacterium]
MINNHNGNTAEASTRSNRSWQFGGLVLFVLALHIPLFFYPILRLASWLALPGWLTMMLLLPLSSSQLISRVLFKNASGPVAQFARKGADFWLGLAPILLMTLLVFELLVLTTGLSQRIAALNIIGFTLFAGFIGLITAITPKVKTIRLTSKKITQPLRFVQVTDVHIGSRSSTFLEKIVFRISHLNPDFVCITGDLIDATGVQEHQLLALKSIAGPVYYCTGNHEKYEDYDQILLRLQKLGVDVLHTKAMHFRPDVQVMGIEDMEDPMQVEKELKHIKLDKAAFKLLLYHRPRGLEAAAANDIDLILSGHTHNGQIFPFNFIVRRVFSRIRGMYQLGESRQYVSQGTGTWGPVLRLGTWSEITLFEYLPE